MKRKRLFGILGTLFILILLFTIIPATPALGATLTPTSSSGVTGATISVVGAGFAPSATHGLFFSSQTAIVGSSHINTTITIYKTLTSSNSLADGTITATFSVPAMMDSGTGGNTAVAAGAYYIYAVNYMGADPTLIIASFTFTVTGVPTITLAPTTGAAGSTVSVTGSNFVPNAALTFTLDTTTPLTPTTGTAATSTGAIASSITIPTGTAAGAHTIKVTATGGFSATATFTVAAAAALDLPSPTHGLAGSNVIITGANFPASTAIIVKLDGTTVMAIVSGTTTQASGTIVSTITIPAGTAAGTHTIQVTVGTTVVSTTFTVDTPPAAALGGPTPSSGYAGTDFTLTGTNFPAAATLVFTWDGAALAIKSGDAAVLANGSFSTTLTVPAAATTTAHTIGVTAGTSTATATFTVTAPPTHVTISANGDYIGSSLVVVASGFQPNSTITITYDGAKIGQGTADATGTLVSAPIAVPASAHGNHEIVVSDGVNPPVTTTFTVESTPPDTPAIIAPAMGATIKSPYLFDWVDVTDPSSPVTYDFQVSTSPDFAANSLKIDKTGLTTSQYELTQADILELTNVPAPLYWRERAIDAASNASGWTGAGTFSIAKPFKFEGPVLWGTIAGVAVVFFLIGFIVGRRTAFYY